MPHTFEVTDAAPGRGRAPPRRRGHLRAARRPHGQAQPHRRVPALGLPRPGLEPRRHLAAGARHRDRPGAHRRACAVLCREASAERAVVVLRATLDSAAPARSCCRTHARRRSTTQLDQPLADGRERGRVDAHGRPARRCGGRGPSASRTLHDVDGRASRSSSEDGGARPTSAGCRTGLRQVRLRRWIALGQRRAALPQGLEPGPDPHGPRRGHRRTSCAGDVDLALDAGLDLLRVHAHITRPELYDAADERGLLLWQDLPLQWGYARGVRKQAVRQAGRGGRPARPPPVGRHLVRPQRADGHRERPRHVGRPEGAARAWP